MLKEIVILFSKNEKDKTSCPATRYQRNIIIPGKYGNLNCASAHTNFYRLASADWIMYISPVIQLRSTPYRCIQYTQFLSAFVSWLSNIGRQKKIYKILSATISYVHFKKYFKIIHFSYQNTGQSAKRYNQSRPNQTKYNKTPYPKSQAKAGGSKWKKEKRKP